MKTKILTAFFLSVFLIALVSAVAKIGTIPEKEVWYADGVTVYKVHVYLDTTGLNGQPIAAAQWRFKNNLFANFTFVNSYLPTHNDFFEGHEMVQGWNYVNPPEQMSGRLVWGDGPSNRSGYLGTYEFKVPVGTPEGAYYFNLTNTKIAWNGQNFPLIVENIPFTVKNPPKKIPAEPSLPPRETRVAGIVNFLKGFFD